MKIKKLEWSRVGHVEMATVFCYAWSVYFIAEKGGRFVVYDDSLDQSNLNDVFYSMEEAKAYVQDIHDRSVMEEFFEEETNEI